LDQGLRDWTLTLEVPPDRERSSQNHVNGNTRRYGGTSTE
jgi:hypothetical protein